VTRNAGSGRDHPLHPLGDFPPLVGRYGGGRRWLLLVHVRS